MRLKSGDPHRLVDLSAVQGERLEQKAFRDAVQADKIDPFPDGAGHVHGFTGSASQDDSELPLSLGVLRSFDGGLPDYLLEALFSSLHAGDASFYDFLGVIDQVLLPLKIRVELEPILASYADAKKKKKNFLEKFQRVLGPRCSHAHLLQLLPALQIRGRSLEALRRIVSWWVERDVCVAVIHEKQEIDVNARTRLSVRPSENFLGRNELLGRFCKINSGRIRIDLLCRDRSDLYLFENDTGKLNVLQAIIVSFLRDPAPVSLHARIARKHVSEPRLRGRGVRGARLGAYHCLSPMRRPEEQTRLKLRNF